MTDLKFFVNRLEPAQDHFRVGAAHLKKLHWEAK